MNDNYKEELIILFNNLKSELVVLEKQIKYDCSLYKEQITGYINSFKNKSYEEIDSKTLEFNNAILNRYNTVIRQTDSKINSSLEKFKSDIQNLSNIDSFISLLNEIKENVKNSFNNEIEYINNIFSNSINEELSLKKNEIISQINVNSNELESKFTNYVSQLQNMIDKSFIDINNKTLEGIDNIYSAEKTSVQNILNMKLKAIEDIKETISGIDITINNFINGAKEEINEHKNSAINEINRTETTIKNIIEVELEKAKAEINNLVELIETSMEEKKAILEQELVTKSNELLKKFEDAKDDFTLDLNRIKQEILSEFTIKLTNFFSVMATREQEILSNIMNITAGFENELEDYRIEQYNEFVSAINSIIEEKTRQLSELIDELLMSLTNEYNKLKQQLIDHTNNELITSLNSTKDNALSEIEDNKVSSIDEILENKESSIGEILETNRNSLDEISRTKDDAIKKIGTSDESMYDLETPSVRKDAIDSIKSLTEDIINKALDVTAEEVIKYINSIKEQKYSTELTDNITEIILPDDFTLNKRNQVFLDGILLIIDKHYTVNEAENKVTLTNPTIGSTDFTIIDYIQDSNVEAIKEKFYLDAKNIANTYLEMITSKYNESMQNITSNANESIQDINSLNDSIKQELDLLKNNTIREFNNNKDNIIAQITTHKELCIEEMNSLVSLFNTTVNEINKQLEQKIDELIFNKINMYVSQKYSKVLDANSKTIKLPDEIVITNRMLVLIDGVLLNENEHYTIDTETKTLTLIETYNCKVNFSIHVDVPTTNTIKF